MKTVELRRHTDNDGDRLTDEGRADASALAKGLTPPYDLFVSTGAHRATETLEIWRSAVGGTTAVVEESGLRSQQEDRWRAAYRAAGSARLDRMRDVEPRLVRDEAATLGAALRRVFDRLPEGGRALVCGHSPTNEAAVLGLTGRVVEPLGKGAGVRIVESGGDYQLEALPGT